MVRTTIDTMTATLAESGYFQKAGYDALEGTGNAILQTHKIKDLLAASRRFNGELQYLASLIHDKIVKSSMALQEQIQDPTAFDPLCEFLRELLNAASDFKKYHEISSCYGDILSLYIMTMSKSAGPGRNSLIIEKILRNIARRKAAELSHARIHGTYSELQEKICVALIAKRYAVHLLATKGFVIRLRAEIDFNTFGNSPEELALQIINILIRNGIKIADVGDLVCGGGDLGPVPDGIYVLNESVRDGSRKRLQNSSLNRGPLVTWELMRLLRAQNTAGQINASVCSPLSFSTLAAKDINALLREKSREVDLELRGYVKVTPLKSTAALISEIEETNPEKLNILVMTLDELFASVVKKIGPRIEREMAAQDANRMLLDFDFGKVMDQLNRENFVVPPSFRLGARDMGTGVREICELMMIVESASISKSLKRSLVHIVDSYAGQVAMVMEMAAAGKPSERPHYILLTSTLAREPYFLRLFEKIRERMFNPHVPMMCVDSLEYEYLIANHFFELYVNPEKSDKRLNINLEARSLKKALRVLSSTSEAAESFSYATLLQQLTTDIAAKRLSPANVVVVGAENEDVLIAVSQAKEQGLILKLSLLGDPNEINSAIRRSKLPLSPGFDPFVRIVPTDPLAVDPESQKKSLENTFREFVNANPEFIVVKGSADTATLLHVALSIYKRASATDGQDQRTRAPLASSTAVFVLPDGRFFALSDAAVNPTFRNSDALLQAIGNQMDVVRKLVQPGMLLKVAIITAVEKETSAIPATLLAAETTKKVGTLDAQYGPLILEGPLSFDLATVPEVVSEKHYEGKIRGDANCLVATEINTANVLYKMLSKTMGSLGLMVDNGAIITAGPGTVPIVLTSRGDTAQTKFNSILLALAYSTKGRQNE
jgi:phosphate butyryltransferase